MAAAIRARRALAALYAAIRGADPGLGERLVPRLPGFSVRSVRFSGAYGEADARLRLDRRRAYGAGVLRDAHADRAARGGRALPLLHSPRRRIAADVALIMGVYS